MRKQDKDNTNIPCCGQQTNQSHHQPYMPVHSLHCLQATRLADDDLRALLHDAAEAWAEARAAARNAAAADSDSLSSSDMGSLAKPRPAMARLVTTAD